MFLSQAEKVKTGFWLSSQNKTARFFFYLLVLFLPTQLGKHFWPNSSFVYGLRLDYLSPTLYLTDIFIFLIFLFSIAQLLKYFKNINKRNLLIFLLFLLSIALGIVSSKNPLAGWYGFIKFLEFAFLSLYVYLNFAKFNKTIIFLFLFFAIAFESLLSFYQYFNQGSIGGLFYFFGERTFNAQTPGIANASINGQLILRPYATFSHPNVLSGFLIIFMLYLFLFYKKNTNGKILLFLGIALGSASLILTLSRVSIILWLFFMLFLFAFSIFEKYKKRQINKKLIVFILGLVIAFLFGYLLFFNTHLFERIVSTRLSDESIIQRKELIDESLRMFGRNPVMGVGINSFYNNLNFNKLSSASLLIQPVHNIFLLVMSETGIIGLIAFVYSFLVILAILIKKGFKKSKYLSLVFLTIIILGMFDHYFLTLQQGQILLSISFGLMFYGKNS